MPGTEAFKKLLEASWESDGGYGRVSFPLTDFSTEFEQDVAEHKYFQVDGASLEPTGRGPLRHSLSIPFRAGLFRAKTESWSALYPEAFDAFFRATSDRRKGYLTHPHFGIRRCQVKTISVKWLADRRDGCDVTAAFVEHEDDLLDPLESDPATKLYEASLNLEASKADLRELAPKAPEVPPDMLASAQRALSARDRLKVAQLRGQGLGARLRGVGDGLTKGVADVRNTVDAIGNPDDRAAAKRSVLWPVAQYGYALQDAANAVDDAATALARSVRVFRNPRRQTLGQIAATIPAPLGDLMSLNPKLLSAALVPEGAEVRHYETA